MHFFPAGDAAHSWTYSLLAGERAREKFATAEAAEFYRRALDAGRTLDVPVEERVRAWRSLAEVTALAGDLASPKAAVAKARGLAPRSEQPKLMLQEGLIREEEGLYSDALRWYTRGEKELPSIEDDG